MTGASPVTTIHEPSISRREAVGSIVVTGLAPVMLPLVFVYDKNLLVYIASKFKLVTVFPAASCTPPEVRINSG